MGVGTGLYLYKKYVLYLLKAFSLGPKYPVCLVAALAEPASAKCSTR